MIVAQVAALMLGLVVGPLAAVSAAQAEAPRAALPPGAEAFSLLGKPLVAPPQPAPARLEQQLAEARAAFEAHPDDPDALVWLGRRTAYLGRYREAIAIFGRGIERHPADARLYRHRGHRHLTVRELALAVADLEKAAELVSGRPDEVEPDGMPNARNIPTSTLQFNIYYHLGLARYLRGELDLAERAYRRCVAVAGSPDSLVAVTHWLYLTLRRLSREAQAEQVLAPITAELDVIENQAYHRLTLMYRGRETPETLAESFRGTGEWPAVGYGLGAWYSVGGLRSRARALWTEIEAEPSWAAFGHLAAEAELARLAQPPAPVTPRPDDASVASLLTAWLDSWRTYDLDQVDRLFLSDDSATYFSSEKQGLIRGIEAIRAHHRGFGFVPRGKPQPNRLWLEGVHVRRWGETVVVGAVWFFQRDGSQEPQQGPMTAVLVPRASGLRIAHMHFASYQ